MQAFELRLTTALDVSADAGDPRLLHIEAGVSNCTELLKELCAAKADGWTQCDTFIHDELKASKRVLQLEKRFALIENSILSLSTSGGDMANRLHAISSKLTPPKTKLTKSSREHNHEQEAATPLTPCYLRFTGFC